MIVSGLIVLSGYETYHANSEDSKEYESSKQKNSIGESNHVQNDAPRSLEIPSEEIPPESYDSAESPPQEDYSDGLTITYTSTTDNGYCSREKNSITCAYIYNSRPGGFIADFINKQNVSTKIV